MSGSLAGLVIMVIGDSHMSHMMVPLHDQLQAAGATVHSYYACGATPNDWVYPSQLISGGCGKGERHGTGPVVRDEQKTAPTYQLSALIAKDHPSLVIVEEGDTIGGYNLPALPKPWIYDQVHNLGQRIKAANVSCVWVGPIYGETKQPFNKPDGRVRELSELLAQSVAPCSYVDSLKFAQPHQWPTIDGEHLTGIGYQAWSAQIVQAVASFKQQNAAR